jgi:hypothetical protein
MPQHHYNRLPEAHDYHPKSIRPLPLSLSHFPGDVVKKFLKCMIMASMSDVRRGFYRFAKKFSI